jgi:hypothetical protein
MALLAALCADDSLLPAAEVADAIALEAPLAALPAALVAEEVLELLQPVTTRASAAAPAIADPILRSFIRCFLPVNPARVRPGP